MPSPYCWRLPARSQRWVRSPGPVIVTAALDELMAAPPMSIAPGVVVVTGGTVRVEKAVGLTAGAAGASRGGRVWVWVVGNARVRAPAVGPGTALGAVGGGVGARPWP